MVICWLVAALLLFGVSGISSMLIFRCCASKAITPYRSGQHMIGKHAGIAGALIHTVQLFDHVVQVEDVVAQHKGIELVTHKVAPNDEGLGNPVRTELHRVLNVHPPTAPSPSSSAKRGVSCTVLSTAHPECRWAFSCSIDNKPWACEHQHELFAHSLHDRVKPGTRAPSLNNASALLYCFVTHSRYVPLWTFTTHSGLFNYHRTVLRMPYRTCTNTIKVNPACQGTGWFSGEL